MCISITPRVHAAAMARRPALDSALLQNQASAKVEVTPSVSLTSDEEREVVSKPESRTSKKRNHHHITVEHNYHDHSHDSRADYQEEHPARGGVTTPFPIKLHEMLEAVTAHGIEDIVSWQAHGRCFLVHKPKEFVELLPYYFKLSKLASFQRQLNLYGFQRLTRGRDRGAYYHELFLRNKTFLAHSIQRIKVKGTGVRARSNPDQEPDFWSMPWIGTETQAVAPVSSPSASYQPTMCAPAYPGSSPLTPPISYPSNPPEDDVVMAFGSKPFHFLEPVKFQAATPVVTRSQPPAWSGMDDLLLNEAKDFFEGFDFPQDFGSDIEDDTVFGNLMEQMIS